MMQRKQLLRIVLVIALLGAGSWLLGRPVLRSQESALTREARAQSEALAPSARERYMPEVGEDPANESEDLLRIGDYWASRVTYPTGQFNQRWLLEAREQDRLVASAVPAGRVTYSRERSASPMDLDPNAFTSLGPEPLQSDGCLSCFNYGLVAGRTNDIVIDPVETNVAYFGSDGGGVWKTDNCCTPETTWRPVTDDPLIANIAIGDLWIDPTDNNVVYAGTGDLRFGSFSFGAAGLLKSTDQGETWEIKGMDVFAPPYPSPPGDYPQYQAIGKVVTDPRNGDTVIVGTKTGVNFSYDGGDTWTEDCRVHPYDTQRHDVTGMVIRDNGSSTDVYVAIGTRGTETAVQPDLNQNGANGVYRTTVPASGCPASWLLTSRPDNGWPIGTGSGIPNEEPGGNILGRVDIAMAPSNPDVIYAVVQGVTVNTHGVLGVWRTINGGNTWEQRADQNDWSGCDGFGAQSWYNQNLEVDPNNPNVVWLDAIDIFKSTNGGSTFGNKTCGYTGGESVHVDQHVLTYVPGSSEVLLAGNDGGVYLTLNANDFTPTFFQLNDTISTIEWYSGDITANFAYDDTPGINAGAQDNGSSVCAIDNDGIPPQFPDCVPGPNAIWQLRKGGDGMYAKIEPVNELRWYQESQNGNLAVTTNGPYSSQINATGGWTGDTKSFVFPYDMFKYDCPATGCQNLIAGSFRVWETVFGGVPSNTWYPNSPDLTKGTLGDRSFINQLAYSFTDQSIAIVGTNDGNVAYGFGLGQGTANTATWVDVTGDNAILPNRPILDVITHGTTPTIGYAAVGGFDQNTPTTPGHVFEVTCNADCSSFTWANKSGNLPNIPADSIMVNPRFPQQVFAGTDWGLYFTDDITAAEPVWYRFEEGLPHAMIWDMAVDADFTTLALFTRSRGAYAWPLPESEIIPPTAVEVSNVSATSPFNPLVAVGLTAGLAALLAFGWAARRRRMA